jgi:hypothetical protein
MIHNSVPFDHEQNIYAAVEIRYVYCPQIVLEQSRCLSF